MRLEEADDLARRLAAPFLVETEGAQRRLVAGEEEDGGVALRTVDVLAPCAARHRERIEATPVEAFAIDDAVTATLERRNQQARGLFHRLGALARAQHL